MAKKKRGELSSPLLTYITGVALAGLGSVWAAASPISFQSCFGLMLVVMGMVVVILAIIVAFQELSNSRVFVASISSVALLVTIGIIVIPWGSRYKDYVRYKEYLDAAHSACNGRGLDWVTTYTNDQSPHPVVIAGRNFLGYRQWSHYNNDLPLDWRPESVTDLQLVVCIDHSDQESIEYCDYHDPRGPRAVSRLVHVLSMRLVNAQTGTILHTVELRGNPPEECSVIGPPPPETVEDVCGDPGSTDAIIQWLDQYVGP
jgi:hypothetical protein